MRRPLRTLCLTLPLAGVAFTTGCVQQDRYDQLMTANRSLQEQLVAAEEENSTVQANLQTVMDQHTRTRQAYSELETRYMQLRDDFDAMRRETDDYLQRVSELEIGPLPAEVESALIDLAAQYPDILTFDAEHGMLRFASDLTFASGSAALRDDAATTIRKVADILTSDAAGGLEAEIVGHTDSVPVSRPATRQKHPNNIYLSVHRAISVMEALTSAGVTPERIQVAGYGPYRPVVANTPSGAAPNRRVEIFLKPMTEPAEVVRMDPAEPTSAAPEAASTSGPQRPRVEPLK